MKRALILLAVLAASTACDRCGTEQIGQLPQAIDQVDVFEQKQAAKVDVLWMVDNSGSMAAEQNKVAERFNEFFSQLIRSAVDYHIGVVTSDPAEGGVLRPYAGPNVDGCTNCRFITTEVSCDNPDVDITSLDTESAIENELLDECQAQLVFRKLVQVGTEGSAFEEGFPQAAAALGAKDVDPATGLPLGNVPPQNEGFIRDDAALYVVFVSDEDEGAKRDGTPVRYYQRLFESLKGAGNENKVAIAAITGYPTNNPDLPPIGEVCSILQTTFDSSLANDDPRAGALVEAMRTFEDGCVDEDVENGDENSFAETGGRYLELACRTGGVVANMCAADYTTALDALGANAAGLIRKFTLSHSVLEIEWGNDCQPDTEDDIFIDCDNDGKTNGPLDGPLCVTAADLTETEPHLVPRDANAGWELEASTNSVRFDGGFLPKPGTNVEIRYLLRPKACNGV